MSRFYTATFLVLILVFGTSFYGLTEPVATKSSPVSLGEWRFIPAVEICDEAPITRESLEKALAWWKKRGYRFGEIREQVPHGACETGSVRGTITIHKIKFGSTSTTYLHVFESGQINWAKIYLTEPTGTRVIEHEVGHALGWDHYDVPGHLMHTNLFLGGWNDSGLSR